MKKYSSKNKLSKIEKKAMKSSKYNPNGVIKTGAIMWENVYDKFPMFGLNKIGEKPDFVNWAQSTLAICPCPDSLFNEEKIEYLHKDYSRYINDKTPHQ